MGAVNTDLARIAMSWTCSAEQMLGKKVGAVARMIVSRAALRLAAIRATKASAELELRAVPLDFVRSERVREFLAQRRRGRLPDQYSAPDPVSAARPDAIPSNPKGPASPTTGEERRRPPGQN